MKPGIQAQLRLLSLLNADQRREACVILAMMVVGMLLEMLGVGLVVPVIVLLMQQDYSTIPSAMQPLFDVARSLQPESLLMGAMAAMVSVYTFKSAFLSLLAWRRSRFAFGMQAEFSQRLFALYVAQPYSFHLSRNSAKLIRNASSEIQMWTGNVVTPALLLVAEGLVLLGLVTLLLFLEPLGTLLVISLLVLLGSGFYGAVRQRIFTWGQQRQHHEGMRIQYLQQSLGSIKEVKVLGREADFIQQFNSEVAASALAAQKQATMQQMPGLWLELIGVLGLIGLVFTMLGLDKDPSSIIPILGLFAAAAFRLMPSANRMLMALQQLRYGLPAGEMLFEELSLKTVSLGEYAPGERVRFQKVIELESVSFSYEDASAHAIKDVSMHINKGEIIGVIGTSGSGKSTLIDILLGLLSPEHGHIRVDGRDIHSRLRDWQSIVGYVPQTIYLTDDSLRRNIALGVPADIIDDGAVRQAVHAAQLGSWVASLPKGLDTFVGERGVRLSGGQRQRIGIARALYHAPEVLLLDEATSALDATTEDGVIGALTALRGKKTIVMVAHRVSTLMQCDHLYRLDYGRLVQRLNPADLACQANVEYEKR